MFRNQFKTAWRNLLRGKFYSAINILGLATGLAIGALILIWVHNELSYDRFHKKSKNIYRVLSNMGTGSHRQVWANSHAPLATFAKKEIPEIRNAVRIKANQDFTVFEYKTKQFTSEKKCYVDSSFLAVFDFKLLKGNAEQAFKGNYSVILTASTAKRYFNNEDPIGKVLTCNDTRHFVVTGVLEDFPPNSSISYDMLFPMSLFENTYSETAEGKVIDEDWGNFSYQTFLQLNAGVKIENVEKKLAVMLQNNYKDIGIPDPYSLQHLTDMHLYNPDGSEGMMQTVRIFIVVGILILVIACINYVNLSTARFLVRAKEVSIRKMIGAGRLHLFIQFIIETSLFVFFAAVVALMMAYLVMPVYNNISDSNITFKLTDWHIWIIACVTVVATVVLSSIYPALLLSSFDPLKSLKGLLAREASGSLLRKILVTIQFVFSATLITCTVIIDRQLTYIHNKELGYDRDYVFTFGMRNMHQHVQSVKAQLQKQQSIVGVTSASDQIIDIAITTGKTDWDGKEEGHRFFIHPITVDEDFFSIFNLQVISGHWFTGASDSTHFILNETAIREAGIIDPVGKRFKLWDTEGIIVGVVKDFHFASLKEKIAPAILQYSPLNSEMYVKTTGPRASDALAAVEKLWKQFSPEYPFAYTFLDDTYDALYKTEQRTGTLFKLFSVVTILISCLGLFGLTTFTAQVKTKEIGIRKVMGASVVNIVELLTKDFVKVVIFAILIAIPLSWYWMNEWLQEYAYRIEMKWWMFALAAFMSLTICMLAAGFQSIKAALMNPVKSLRTD